MNQSKSSKFQSIVDTVDGIYGELRSESLELLELMKAQKAMPNPGETPESHKQEIENCINLGRTAAQLKPIVDLYNEVIAHEAAIKRLVLYYSRVPMFGYVMIHYELHSLGAGISEVQHDTSITSSVPEFLIDHLGYPSGTPYYLEDIEMPDGYDNEPMNHKLIINPAEGDEE